MIKKKLLLCLFIFFLLLPIFSGCKSDNTKTPREHIEKIYHNKQFKISFNSQSLTKPLESVNYSAKLIPELPVPEKLGYIFSGWYFDKELTRPFSDDALIYMMRDVVLYPKWEEEKFVQNGIYGIKFHAKILEETIVKSEKSDDFGGFKDFTDFIISENSYIEKSNNELILKIEYDNKTTVMWGEPDPFIVSTSPLNKPVLGVKDKIESLSNSLKAIFIDITNADLTKPIYLDVQAINYYAPSLSKYDREKTLTKYVVAFQVEKFLGFDRNFVNLEQTLEDGVYLLKSFYRQINNDITMMSGFNPVYGYLVAKDGSYKYVKPFVPYYGLLGNESDLQKPLNKNFYKRFMTFVPINSFYRIDAEISKFPEKITNDYYPELWQGSDYKNFSMEYNASTNMFYQIFDLESDLKKNIVFRGSATGFMENASAMGSFQQIMILKFDEMVRIPKTNYSPLTGDAFKFSKTYLDYPGNLTDMNKIDATYQTVLKYGMSQEFYNFFYSFNHKAPGVKKIHSFRFKSFPVNSDLTKDRRFNYNLLNCEYEIFDYDVNDTLMGDMMQTSTFDECGIRAQVLQMNGAMKNVGDKIDLKKIFYEKVSRKLDFSAVNFKAYKIKDGLTDFQNPVNITSEFNFTEDIDIFFSFKEKENNFKARVRFVKYVDPVYQITENASENFILSKEYIIGERFNLPYFTAQWGNVENAYVGKWYHTNEDETGIGYKPTNFILFSVKESIKNQRYFAFKKLEREVEGNKEILVYEIKNVFGERKYVEYTLNTKPRPHYIVKNSLGDVLIDHPIRITQDGSIASEFNSAKKIITRSEFNALKPVTYFFSKGGDFSLFKLSYYQVKTKDNYYKNYDLEGKTQDEVYDEILTLLASSGGIVDIGYQNEKDQFNLKLVVDGSVDGKYKFTCLDYETYFVNRKYYFLKPRIVDKAGNILSHSRITIYKLAGGIEIPSFDKTIFETENIGNQLSAVFKTPGLYRIRCYYTASYAIFTYEDFEVKDLNSEIKITYKTDSEHPFSDGSLEKTFTYFLNNPIFALKQNAFSETTARLNSFKWGNVSYKPGEVMNGLINNFNSDKITLVCFWSNPVTLTIDLVKDKTGLDPFVKTYYPNPGEDYCSINYGSLKFNIPSNFIYLGLEGSQFTGGFISLEEMKKQRLLRIYKDTTLKARIKQKFTIKYEIDSNYSDTFYINELIVEGEKLIYRDCVCKKPGYQFVGWFIKGDALETLIDFNSYLVTGNLTIVAKFILN